VASERKLAVAKQDNVQDSPASHIKSKPSQDNTEDGERREMQTEEQQSRQ
jgi:hypothetical protein